MCSKMFSKCYILVVGTLKCPVLIVEVEYSLIIMKGSCYESILSLVLGVKNSQINTVYIYIRFWCLVWVSAKGLGFFHMVLSGITFS